MEKNKNCSASNRQPKDHPRRQDNDRLSDALVDYLRTVRPTLVGGLDNNPVIIPPLNTDVRFDNYLPTPTQYNNYRLG
jgi:hypothetical protein